jgi:hypothetical protein
MNADGDVLAPAGPTPDAAALAEQVGRVADLRRNLAVLEEALREKRRAFEEGSADTRAGIEAAGAELLAAENVVRALALAHYLATRDKAPTPGVTVREYEELQYEPAAAFAWAREKQMALLPERLDVKAFEKIAKATPLAFVKVEQHPRVVLATDLEKALGRVVTA